MNLDNLYALLEKTKEDKPEKKTKAEELKDKIEDVKKKETRGFISDDEADDQISEIKAKLESVKVNMESQKMTVSDIDSEIDKIQNDIINCIDDDGKVQELLNKLHSLELKRVDVRNAEIMKEGLNKFTYK